MPRFAAVSRPLLVAVAAFCTATASFAQKTKDRSDDDMHLPAFFIHYIEQSKLTYAVSIDTTRRPCPDRTDKLNTPDYYQEPTGSGGFAVKRYQLAAGDAALFEKAEAFFQKDADDSAAAYYAQVTAHNPAFAEAWVYQGQLAAKAGKYGVATDYYRKAIAANPINYMAHWFLADLLSEAGGHREAVAEISLAYILNRNNPRIQKRLKSVFTRAGYQFQDWCFEPQMTLARQDNGDIALSYAAAPWLAYAMAKAVWKYEPEFRKKYNDQPGVYNHREERECLMNLAYGLALDSAKTYAAFPELAALQQAVDAKFFGEYLLLEITLPQYPEAALSLPPDALQRLQDYVLAVRAKKR